MRSGRVATCGGVTWWCGGAGRRRAYVQFELRARPRGRGPGLLRGRACALRRPAARRATGAGDGARSGLRPVAPARPAPPSSPPRAGGPSARGRTRGGDGSVEAGREAGAPAPRPRPVEQVPPVGRRAATEAPLSSGDPARRLPRRRVRWSTPIRDACRALRPPHGRTRPPCPTGPPSGCDPLQSADQRQSRAAGQSREMLGHRPPPVLPGGPQSGDARSSADCRPVRDPWCRPNVLLGRAPTETDHTPRVRPPHGRTRPPCSTGPPISSAARTKSTPLFDRSPDFVRHTDELDPPVRQVPRLRPPHGRSRPPCSTGPPTSSAVGPIAACERAHARRGWTSRRLAARADTRGGTRPRGDPHRYDHGERAIVELPRRRPRTTAAGRASRAPRARRAAASAAGPAGRAGDLEAGAELFARPTKRLRRAPGADLPPPDASLCARLRGRAAGPTRLAAGCARSAVRSSVALAGNRGFRPPSGRAGPFATASPSVRAGAPPPAEQRRPSGDGAADDRPATRHLPVRFGVAGLHVHATRHLPVRSVVAGFHVQQHSTCRSGPALLASPSSSPPPAPSLRTDATR